MLNFAILILLLMIGILVWGFLKKTLIFNKLLYLNVLTNIVVVTIVALGTYPANSSYLDIALIYAMLGFIGIQAFMRYFRSVQVTPPNDESNHASGL